jgi:hypothetical protein
MLTTVDAGAVVDVRAEGSLVQCDPPVAAVWHHVTAVAQAGPPEMGLSAGERPAADVEVLAGVVASAEYAVAARMHAAAVAGGLPLAGPGGMLVARGWSTAVSRRLARAGALAATYPSVAGAWAAGVITSEHVDPVARHADRFTGAELAAVVEQLAPLWGQLSPAAVARFVQAAARMLHPPEDPSPDEADALESRDLSFAITSDTVLLSAALPRVEGELVMAAIDAIAETLRSTADHVPAGARRADALVQLVNTAHAADSLPTRGGLPVGLTVTLEHTALGDPVWTTSRGHDLTGAEARWASCDAQLTPILSTTPQCPEVGGAGRSRADARPGTATSAARLAALAATLFESRIPLAVGRSQRTATPAQRRALALRDGGCIIPGCGVPAEACQIHHLTEWADGGNTDLDNLATLCWAHHRQVDLLMWEIRPLIRSAGARESDSAVPSGSAWPANHGAPFTITRTPRSRWRT